jgi:hypothetical protein
MKSKIKSNVMGILVWGIIFSIGYLFYYNIILEPPGTRIVTLKDGHKYIKSTGWDGSINYEHYQGCTHEKHK